MKTLWSTFICLMLALGMVMAQSQEQENEKEVIVTQPSSYTMDETIDVLKEGIEEMGLNLMAEIDHAGAAANNDLELLPSKILIFGNPAIGTQLMRTDQRVGLDLPLRMLVWENEDGRVFMSYRAVSTLQDDFAIEEHQDVLQKMEGALEKLSRKAILPDESQE